MSGGKYEFVVAGTLGPMLRSMFDDLDIEDRSAQTELLLRSADESALMSLLAAMINSDREIQHIQMND